ncbi:UNVERIFIED_CONTAM: hypothetical protein FKN15_054799 [Acipenser sinensis]
MGQKSGGEYISQDFPGAFSRRKIISKDFPGAFSRRKIISQDLPGAFSRRKIISKDLPGAFSRRKIISQDLPDAFSRIKIISQDLPGAFSRRKIISQDLPGAFSRRKIISQDLPGAFSRRKIISQDLPDAFSRIKIISQDLPDAFSRIKIISQDLPDAFSRIKIISQDLPDAFSRIKIISQDLPDAFSRIKIISQDLPDAFSRIKIISQDLPDAFSRIKIISQDLPDAFSRIKIISQDLPDAFSRIKIISQDLPDAFSRIKIISQDLPDAFSRIKIISQDLPDAFSRIKIISQDLPDAFSRRKIISQDLPGAFSRRKIISQDLPVPYSGLLTQSTKYLQTQLPYSGLLIQSAKYLQTQLPYSVLLIQSTKYLQTQLPYSVLLTQSTKYLQTQLPYSVLLIQSAKYLQTQLPYSVLLTQSTKYLQTQLPYSVLLIQSTKYLQTQLPYSVLLIQSTNYLQTQLPYSVLLTQSTKYLQTQLPYSILLTQSTKYLQTQLSYSVLLIQSTKYLQTQLPYSVLLTQSTKYLQTQLPYSILLTQSTKYLQTQLPYSILLTQSTKYLQTQLPYSVLLIQSTKYLQTQLSYSVLLIQSTKYLQTQLPYSILLTQSTKYLQTQLPYSILLTQSTKILVGAPQARGLPSQGANHTGALYQCPITGEEWDCERVDIDEDVDLERESKENQWLGVTVKSQGVGGKVVACAHLYELRQRFRQPSETRDPIGRCYVLSEDLTVRDDLDGGEWKFCEGRPQGHEQFGFCQQGMAAGFTPDNSYILFGAPGTYHWKGELRLQLVNLTGLDRGVFDDGPYEVADEKLQDSRLIPLQYNSYLGLLFMASPVEDALVYRTLDPSDRGTSFEDVAQNSYLGFSVDSAHGITSPQELSFVAGAPRANHRGAVVLLKKDNVYRLVPEHILWGSEVASSFGYSVAVADLNNDGWTDLVVGAPNVFDRKAEIGGAVYVYINPSGLWKRAIPVRLNGTYDSMFGLTVTSVGDLNQDGFADIAVGAPFDGDGKVYIYHGSASGINTKPAQVLDGEGVGVKLFGYSLSGGMDIDGNSYPDLVVGSLSDSVVLYSSQCDASPLLTALSAMLHLLSQLSVRCFTSSHSSQCDVSPPPTALSVMFEADSERRKLGLPHRINFLERRSSEPEYQRSEDVELRGQHARACQSAIFQLQDSLRDKLSPISVSASYSIKQTRHSNQPTNKLGTLSPVLNAALPSTLRTEVNFLREGCGDDKICQSNLQLSYRFGTRATTTDLFTPLAVDMEGMPVFSLSDQKTVALEVTVTNLPSDPRQPQKDGDDAHAAQLLDKQLVCAANPNGSYAECELGNPMKRNGKVTFYIILSTSAITIETTDLTVNLQLLTISEQPDLQPIVARARVVIELPLSVTGMAVPHQLFFSGTTKGESAMTSQEDVGSAVEYKFTVTNPGQSLQTLGSAFLNVMWPHELSNGKWLLYPTGMYFKGDRNTHCSTSQPLNPLRLTDYHNLPGQTDYHSRKGRSNQEKSRIQTQGIVGRTTPAVSASERRKLLTLDCLLGSARCILFQCPLHSFDGSAELTVHARLWNSSFLEVSRTLHTHSSIKNDILLEYMNT